jgi:hypothetical protein
LPEFINFAGWTTFNRHILSAGVDIPLSKSVSITSSTRQTVLEGGIEFPCYRRCGPAHTFDSGQAFALTVKKLHCGATLSNITNGFFVSPYGIQLVALPMTIDDATGLERPYLPPSVSDPLIIAEFYCQIDDRASDAEAYLLMNHFRIITSPTGTLEDPLTGGTFTPRVPNLLTKLALGWSWKGLTGESVNAEMTAVLADLELHVGSLDVFNW